MSRTTDREIFRDLHLELHPLPDNFAPNDWVQEMAECIRSRIAAPTAQETQRRAPQQCPSHTTRGNSLEGQKRIFCVYKVLIISNAFCSWVRACPQISERKRNQSKCGTKDQEALHLGFT